jgi:Flp pilus assembly protein TadG
MAKMIRFPSTVVLTLFRKLKNGQSSAGQALVELTLLAPLLLLILLGTIGFGRVFFHTMGLAHAARAGAAYGAQSVAKSTDIAGMQKAAEDAAARDLGTINVTPAPTRYFQCGTDPATSTEPASCADGKPAKIYVEVTVQKTFDTYFNFPGIPSSVNISRKAIMRVR